MNNRMLLKACKTIFQAKWSCITQNIYYHRFKYMLLVSIYAINGAQKIRRYLI